jgi:hypothetical protein
LYFRQLVTFKMGCWKNTATSDKRPATRTSGIALHKSTNPQTRENTPQTHKPPYFSTIATSPPPMEPPRPASSSATNVALALDTCSPRACPALRDVLAEVAQVNQQLEAIFAAVDALDHVVQGVTREVGRHEAALELAEDALRQRSQPSHASRTLASLTGGLWGGARASAAQVFQTGKQHHQQQQQQQQPARALQAFEPTPGVFESVLDLCQTTQGKALLGGHRETSVPTDGAIAGIDGGQAKDQTLR